MEKKAKKGRPKYNLRQNTAHIFALAIKYQWGVIATCLIPPVLTVLMRLTSIYIAPSILARIEEGASLSVLLKTIAFFAVMTVFLRCLYSFVSNRVGYGRETLCHVIRVQVVDKIERTSFANLSDQGFLNKMHTAERSIYCYSVYWWKLGVSVTNLLGFIAYIFVLGTLNIGLILFSIVTVLICAYYTKRLNEWRYSLNEERSRYDATLNHVLERAQNNAYAKDIRLFAMQDWLIGIYDRTVGLCRTLTMRENTRAIALQALDAFMFFLRNGVSYAYLLYITLKNGWSASEFLLYFNAISDFINWINAFISGFTSLHEQSIGISAIREFLDLPEPFVFEQGEKIPQAEANGHEITLRDVSFRYPGAESDTLHGINLTLHSGEHLAIVGENGAGKTTLVNLICGLYDPSEGAVLLDGVDIKAYDRREYYKLFSSVFQNFSVLDATIAENIAQDIFTPDMERIEECAERAGLTAMIDKLPAGFATHLGKAIYEDGIELSGGQTQRLMLARALYRDTPFLILDEPTAALDPIAESEIYESYHALTADKTTLYISHRLASTRFCDRVIYISDGGITENGTHAQLLAADGRYAHMFELQAKYYKKGKTEGTGDER